MIRFTVNWAPVAQPRQRHSGKVSYVPADHPIHAFKMAVHLASSGEVMKLMAHGGMLLGPVVVVLEFVMPRPKRLKKGGRAPCGVKPDADNLAKAVLDVLNGRVYKDDGQVCNLTVLKWYAGSDEKPHANVAVQSWEEIQEELARAKGAAWVS